MHAIYEDRSYSGNLPVVAIESRSMSFFAHWHEDVELICVCEGSILIGINHESRLLHKGDLVVCSSGDIHFYDCKGSQSIHRMLIFRPELIDCPGGWPQDIVFSSPFLLGQADGELHGAFHHAFETVRRETKRSDRVSPMMVRGSLLNLCGSLERAIQAQPATDKDSSRHRLKGMQDVLSFIESNYMENIRLEDAAELAKLSVSHFSRLFASIAGLGFKSYLTQFRVNKAEDLLKKSGDSITDIAYQCGFGSTRSFNRAFITSRGVPPSKLR